MIAYRLYFHRSYDSILPLSNQRHYRYGRNIKMLILTFDPMSVMLLTKPSSFEAVLDIGCPVGCISLLAFSIGVNCLNGQANIPTGCRPFESCLLHQKMRIPFWGIRIFWCAREHCASFIYCYIADIVIK